MEEQSGGPLAALGIFAIAAACIVVPIVGIVLLGLAYDKHTQRKERG